MHVAKFNGANFNIHRLFSSEITGNGSLSICLIPFHGCNTAYRVIRTDRILFRPVQVVHPNVHLGELRQLQIKKKTSKS